MIRGSNQRKEVIDSEMKDFSGNESTVAVVADIASDEDKEGAGPESQRTHKPPIGSTRRSTGPRTQLGKERSKNNAHKHGIFSKVAVLPGESQVEFNSLLTGLRNDRQPAGALEETLVDKIAVLFWRNRRLYVTEAAEIRSVSLFSLLDLKERDRQETFSFPQLHCNGGLIRWITNSDALKGCLGLLVELKNDINKHGFQPESDDDILTMVYGSYGPEEQKNDWRRGVRFSYLLWSATSSLSQEERQAARAPSPQSCTANFQAHLSDEIKGLESRAKREMEPASSRSRKQPSGLRMNISELLLRYEITLERSIERLLSQLERVQRMRLGQPAPPSINLNLNDA